MSSVRVSGYVINGQWRPIKKEDISFVPLYLNKTKAGKAWLRNNLSKIGFATAVIGIGNQRNKLMRFERNEGMYNIIVVSNLPNTILFSAYISEKRFEFKKKLKVATQSFGATICRLLEVTELVDNSIKLELRCEATIAEDLVQAFRAINVEARITDRDWNEISLLPEEVFSETIAPEEPAKDIERIRSFFIVEPDVNAAFTAANYMKKTCGVGKVLLTGPSGFGKTTAAKMVAEKLGYKFVKVDCATLTEPNDIVHTVSFRNGQTLFDKTPFVKAIEAGKYVILLDELNRAYPNVLNTLMPILDDTRQITVGTEVYTVADDIIFVATMNIGQQYVGTYNYDAALVNRFPSAARVGNLTGEEESQILYHHSDLSLEMASEVVAFLREIRKTLTTSVLDFSPRTAKAIGVAMGCGLDVHAATRTVLHAIATDEEWKEIVDVLQRRGFPFTQSKKLMF